MLTLQCVFVSSDIDECAEGLIECHNHSRCVNLPGWYHCECRSGFHDNGSYLLDGSSCIGEHTLNSKTSSSLFEIPAPRVHHLLSTDCSFISLCVQLLQTKSCHCMASLQLPFMLDFLHDRLTCHSLSHLSSLKKSSM